MDSFLMNYVLQNDPNQCTSLQSNMSYHIFYIYKSLLKQQYSNTSRFYDYFAIIQYTDFNIHRCRCRFPLFIWRSDKVSLRRDNKRVVNSQNLIGTCAQTLLNCKISHLSQVVVLNQSDTTIVTIVYAFYQCWIKGGGGEESFAWPGAQPQRLAQLQYSYFCSYYFMTYRKDLIKCSCAPETSCVRASPSQYITIIFDQLCFTSFMHLSIQEK